MRKHYYRIILILLTVLCVIGAVYTIPFVRIAAVVVFLAPGSEHELGVPFSRSRCGSSWVP